jgi:hypothetical protein
VVSLAGAVFIVVAAVWLALALKAPAHVREALIVSRQGMAALQDRALSDDDKEALMQKQSLQLFRLFFLILAVFAVAIGAPVVVLWGLGELGVLSFDEVIRTSISVKFLVGCTVIGTLLAFAVRARRKV